MSSTTGANPLALVTEGFPGTLCIEVNGLWYTVSLQGYVLREGMWSELTWWWSSTAITVTRAIRFPSVRSTQKVMQLLKVTKESLYVGIEAARAGKRVGDISNAVQTWCERRGYSVVREMCGHGIGRDMHEDPEVPNYGRRGIGPVLRKGMCIAIEAYDQSRQQEHSDKSATAGNAARATAKPSAHFEHTVAITDGAPEILTTFRYIDESLGSHPLRESVGERRDSAQLNRKIQLSYMAKQAAIEQDGVILGHCPTQCSRSSLRTATSSRPTSLAR